MFKNRYTHLPILLFALCFLFAANCNAGDEIRQIPWKMKPSLDHLLNLTAQDNSDQPDMGAISQVLDFLLTPKDLSATYSAGIRNGATSNYFEFTIARSLQDIIALAYNPEIPSYFIIPASLHQSHWIESDGKPQPFPDISKTLGSGSKPVIFKGVEFMENTPDIYSGAYYAYKLDRAVVLTRYKGHRVLLSMSSQRDKSDVGKKGLVLGSDDDWNYLYTGEKGCTRTGLGWVDSYMYNSESIMVYYEMMEPKPHVRCAVFKWVDAGWAGINMAQPHHIKKGVQRFVKTFKQVAESTSLPRPSELAAAIRQIDDLPTQALQEKVRDHFNVLKARHQDDNRLNRKWFSRLFDDDRYIEGMSREELQAILCKEYLKYLLGKSHSFDMAFFEKARDRSKHPG